MLPVSSRAQRGIHFVSALSSLFALVFVFRPPHRSSFAPSASRMVLRDRTKRAGFSPAFAPANASACAERPPPHHARLLCDEIPPRFLLRGDLVSASRSSPSFSPFASRMVLRDRTKQADILFWHPPKQSRRHSANPSFRTKRADAFSFRFAPANWSACGCEKSLFAFSCDGGCTLLGAISGPPSSSQIKNATPRRVHYSAFLESNLRGRPSFPPANSASAPAPESPSPNAGSRRSPVHSARDLSGLAGSGSS
jgi:hypothetical protein